MERSVNEKLGKFNLSSTYREYKKDTEYIAGWLADNAKRCGHSIQPPKAGKAAKSQVSGGDALSATQYVIRVADFTSMAHAIASFEPRIDVPKALEKVFNRAIKARLMVWSWFESSQKGHKSNHRHSHFIDVLVKAIKALKPLISQDSNDGELDYVPVQNRFKSLPVEETDPYDDLIPEVRQQQLPKVATASVKQDEEGLEEEFFFAIESFLKELDEIRMFVLGEWLEYFETGQGLTRAALLANTAVDLVRSAEYQLGHALIRPKKYPADKFPVWTLPALLYYRSHERFQDQSPDLFVTPSLRFVSEDALHRCDQERYCFWNVYAALKIYLFARQKILKTPTAPLTPQALQNPPLASATWFTLEWAQIFNATNEAGLMRFGIDEATRGIKHILDKEEVNIWVTFAMQIHVDLTALKTNDKKALERPFEEYHHCVRRSLGAYNDYKAATVSPFPKTNNTAQVPGIRDRMTDILKDHRAIAIYDRWGRAFGRQKDNYQQHPIIGPTLERVDYVLKNHPMRCGLLKYELESQLHDTGMKIEYLSAEILSLGWLYIVGSRLLYPDSPRWPDMEFVLHQQGHGRLFHGGLPKSLSEAGKKLDLARGESAVNQARDRKDDKVSYNKANLRRIENQSPLSALFLDRMSKERPTEEVHQWVTKLVSLISKPDSQKVLDRQENLPIGKYETSEFLRSKDLQRSPGPLLKELHCWILADAVDHYFDWLGIHRTCTDIWNALLPILKEDALLSKHLDELRTPEMTASRIIHTAFVSGELGLPSPTFQRVWDTMQGHLSRTQSTRKGDACWVADSRMVALLDSWENLGLVFANPGPVNLMKLYMHWSTEDLKESRFGRGIWTAMHAANNLAKNLPEDTIDNKGEERSAKETKKDDHTHRKDEEAQRSDNKDDGDDDDDDEDNDDDDDDSDASDLSDLEITSFTVDLNKLNKNNVTFVNNRGQLLSGQSNHLRAGPGNSISFAPPQSRISKHNKLVSLRQETPKVVRPSKPFSHSNELDLDRSEQSGGKAPTCACGHGNFAVSSRPINAMSPMVKGEEFEHMCLGEIYEGVPTNGDTEYDDAVTVEKIRIKVR